MPHEHPFGSQIRQQLMQSLHKSAVNTRRHRLAMTLVKTFGLDPRGYELAGALKVEVAMNNADAAHAWINRRWPDEEVGGLEHLAEQFQRALTLAEIDRWQ